MIDALPLLLGPEGYLISRSVRLRSSASAYFNRTLTTPTDGKKWTYSVWVKRGILTAGTGTAQQLLSAGSGTAIFRFSTTDTLVSGWTGAANLETTQVFRDPSAWYHIMLVVDTTQATASNRVKYYVNGTQITAFATTDYPTQNSTTTINSAVAHNIGAYTSSTQYLDGYLTEINFIDGQALTPSSFGENDTVTGVWKPKKYTGTYGNNGFYLNFSDNSAATAAAIGKDYSGNGNNWTPNNISVTAGVTYDSMLDVPTQWADGGNGRGNYAVLNPLLSAGGATANGNLQVTTATGVGHSRATIAIPASGKWYAEFTAVSAATSTDYIFGIVGADTAEASYGYNQTPSYSYTAYGERVVNGTFTASFYSSYTTGDVIGCAVNLDANEITWYKNGTAQTAISITNGSYFWMVTDASGTRQITAAFNAGQRPFAYTPPSGFKALNTQNLPTPTILKGNQYFDATTYTGTGASLNVVNSGGMQPDFVWTKPRSTAVGHTLFDSVRGVTKYLQSNTTGAEGTAATSLTAFNSDGFTVNSDTSTGANGVTYVGWQWKEGATQGFDIVTYTESAGVNTIPHSLGVTPKMFITKRRDGVENWVVWFTGFANTEAMYLNGTAAKSASGSAWISLNSSNVQVTSGQWTGTGNKVAYLFAEVAGFSRFGTYTGNGSTDGPFVFCGFRPRWIMVKITSGGTGFWHLIDTARDTYNQNGLGLYPNSSNAESSDFASDTLSNGFKIRNTQSEINGSGFTYIFAAFAEHPFKNALAR